MNNAAPYAYDAYITQGRHTSTKILGLKSLGIEMLDYSREVGWKRVELITCAIYFTREETCWGL